jgi:pimeloyl-ACP methyl ester carboxylesterase
MAGPRPNLHFTTAPNIPGAVVLVLHGGREASLEPTRSTQLSVLRMIPIARRIARLGGGQLAVARLRFAVRGWNGELLSPVADAHWAMDQLAERFPGLPIGLVGHSMGGRTALRAAGHDGVQAVVGLAPWLPPGEPTEQLAGRRVLLVHGTADRMTSPRGSAALADRLSSSGIGVSLVDIRDERHGMLRQPKVWHDLAGGFLMRVLLGQSIPTRVPNLLQKVADGDPRITV